MYDFGLRLKELRLKQGLSQVQLAKRLNLTNATISAYESNIRQPTLDTLCKLSSLFNVTTDYLLGMNYKEHVFINKLTENQKDIINMLLLEFDKQNRL